MNGYYGQGGFQPQPAERWYNPNRFNAADAAICFMLSALILCGLQFAISPLSEGFSSVPFLLDVFFTLLSQGAMIAIALVASKKKKVDLYRGGGDYFDKRDNRVGWVFVLFLGCAFVFSPLTDLFLGALFTPEQVAAATARDETGPLLYLYFAMVVVLPAICEESLFRGVIARGLEEFGKIPAILISALFFMLMHASPLQTVYQFFLGVALGFLMVETGNIYLCMIFHGANNLLAAVTTIEDYINSPAGKIVYIVFSVIVGIVCLIFAVNAFLPEEKKFLRKNPGRAAQEDLRYIPFGFASRKEYVEAMKKQAGRYYYAVKKRAPDGETTDVTAPYYEKETYAAAGEVKAFYLDREGWVSFNKKSSKVKFAVFTAIGVLADAGLWALLYVAISNL